ncbi:hypothetical protein [Bacillus sp. S/N-304-OC-R1]|uniref:hypothetical protein n=1 Tax=Bacillus sp. S/N-304-OC-R1 TaxID=2758034 RepID=UPI001C8ED8FA|nr:hypothetical protein [Bacillus sp. S/N-304-OC-R1]MBY0120538.1 hypothetical protein [Bacillus sp. S/N-304-OC-R1]
MDSEKVEKLLHEIKKDIYVDQELKKQLKETFVKKKKMKFQRRSLVSTLVAAAVFFAVFFNYFQIKQTNASAFNIQNAISFLDVGSGEITSYTYHGEILYVSIKNQGIFSYTSSGYKKITEETADSLSHSQHTNSLLFSQNGGIFIFNLDTKKKEEIVSGGYSQPVWKNDENIYAEKLMENKTIIVEINTDSKEEKVISIGQHPSFNEKEYKLVFERDGEIMIRNKTGKEIVVDKGKDPNISKGGSYISYVQESDGFENVWISDFNLKTKKKVTSNPPSRENPKVGLYKYHSSVWSSDERTLYVLKKDEIQANSRIMMISLSESEVTSKDTVIRYLQALLVRDDDYAKGMMENPPEFLTYSNPSQIGYKIINVLDSEDRATVTAEVYWTYTATPYYKISTYEFELYKANNRFVIKGVTEKETKEIFDLDTGRIQLLKNGQIAEDYFSLEDIPKSMLNSENIRISSLVLAQSGNEIIFSLQEMNEKKPSNVSILKYNIKAKIFSLVGKISSEQGQDIVIEKMSIDSTGGFVSADVFDGEISRVVVADINKGESAGQFNKTHTIFWQGNSLLIEENNEYFTTLYKYDPEKSIKNNF